MVPPHQGFAGGELRSVLSMVRIVSQLPLTIIYSHQVCKFLAISLWFLTSQLSATDASARTTMKGAAKCDKHCKLQNSANQQNFERILRFRDMPESMPTSEPPTFDAPGSICFGGASLCISTQRAADALNVSGPVPSRREHVERLGAHYPAVL